MEQVLKTHVEEGGTLININVLDKEKLMKAHENPLLYPDLVVRVTGFTAYFATLSPEFRYLGETGSFPRRRDKRCASRFCCFLL